MSRTVQRTASATATIIAPRNAAAAAFVVGLHSSPYCIESIRRNTLPWIKYSTSVLGPSFAAIKRTTRFERPIFHDRSRTSIITAEAAAEPRNIRSTFLRTANPGPKRDCCRHKCRCARPESTSSPPLRQTQSNGPLERTMLVHRSLDCANANPKQKNGYVYFMRGNMEKRSEVRGRPE